MTDVAGLAPPLVGAVAGKRSALFPGLPNTAFDQPILTGRGLFGRYAVISDPAGVRRVLVENAANYPKTALDLRFFTALFGGGLLGSDGAVWRRHRRVMAPAFDPRSVAAYGPAIAAAARTHLARWSAMPDGAAVDMAEEMKTLALQVISRTVFSTNSEDIIGLVGGTLSRGLDAAAEANILDLTPVIGEWRMRARERRLAAASVALDVAIAKLVAQREADIAEVGADAPRDLLTRLVAAKDDVDGGGLTAKEIRDEIITIFMAGHETTAGALSWTWYLLSQHPEASTLLETELDRVLGSRPPEPDDLPRLTYTRQVVEEALRLYPSAPGLSTRRTLADDTVCGHRIARGTRVMVMPWVVHRHRRLWADPDAFDPGRFAPEQAAGRPRFAYLPFGGGPRVCIGQVLALNETILILASLAQAFRPSLAPHAVIEPRANVTLQFRHGLPMRLDRRPL